MTLSDGPRSRVRGSRLVTLLSVVVIALLTASAARAATPSLLAGQQVDGHNSAFNDVSCGSPSHCVAGGLDLIVQDHAVRSDLTSQLSSSTDEVSAISCAPGTAFCVVGDDSGGLYALSGTALSARSVPGGGDAIDSVSCATTTFCMAIDDTGHIFRFDGSSWSPSFALSGVVASGLLVSCATTSFCVAEGPGIANDNDSAFDGTGWTSKPAVEGSGAAVTGLSCTSPTFCIATDTRDNALKFNGTSWTMTGSNLSGGSGNSDAFKVSCAGQFCQAASAQTGDTFLSADGVTWTAGDNIKVDNGGFGGGGPISCPSATMCVIVDQSGNGYTWALPDTAPAPTLAGTATVGSTLTVTPGAVTNPDASAVTTLQRCLGGCAALPGSSYVTTAADVDADFRAAETTGVGLDLEGPVSSNTVGPIIAAGGGGSTGPPPNPGSGAGTPLRAKVGPASLAGTTATLGVSCPAKSSRSCRVALSLTIIEKLKGKKHKTVSLGNSVATLNAGGKRQLAVSLNAAGRRLLAARHRLTVLLTASQSGKTLVSENVHFTAPHKHHHKRKHHKK